MISQPVCLRINGKDLCSRTCVVAVQVNAEPGVVADRSRLQEGYRSMCRGRGWFQGARKRAGS